MRPSSWRSRTFGAPEVTDSDTGNQTARVLARLTHPARRRRALVCAVVGAVRRGRPAEGHRRHGCLRRAESGAPRCGAPRCSAEGGSFRSRRRLGLTWHLLGIEPADSGCRQMVCAAKSVHQVEGTLARSGVVDDEGVFQLPQPCAQACIWFSRRSQGPSPCGRWTDPSPPGIGLCLPCVVVLQGSGARRAHVGLHR